MENENDNKKSRHTPGPWLVEVCKVGQSSITGLKYEDSLIQPINVLVGRHAAGETSYNAALIAAAPFLPAAPFLLAALESTLSALEEYMGSDGRRENADYLANKRAAIAKARGRQD